jgi:hypothetical protein
MANDVALDYAKAKGLEYRETGRLPSPPSRGRLNMLSFYGAVTGPIGASQRTGTLYLLAGGKASGPPAAMFEIPGLDRAIDGLSLRRSGTNFLTRQPLPRNYIELKELGEEFGSRYRAGIAAAADEHRARQLLDPEFTSWYVQHAPQGGAMSQAGSLDISSGVLYLRSMNGFESLAALDMFAEQASAIAERIAGWASRT